MKNDKIFIGVALLLNIVAGLTYDYLMVYGESKPNAASWAVWAFITILNAKSYKETSKDLVKYVFPVASAILCIFTFGLTLFEGRVAFLRSFDLVVLLLGILTSLIWWKTKSAKIAQIILQICVAIGFIPTYMSVAGDPHAEALLPWILWSFSFALHAYVVKLRKGKVIDFLYPVNSVVLHFAVAVMILVL